MITTAESQTSLIAILNTSKRLIENSSPEAITKLNDLQCKISSQSLFSSNEVLDDISTWMIPLLLTEHYLGLAHVSIPQNDNIERIKNILLSMDYFHCFLQKMDALGILEGALLCAYHEILKNEDGKAYRISREEKIERYRRKREIENKLNHFESLDKRRKRLGMSAEEEIDGYDDEALSRTLNIIMLKDSTCEAMDELFQASKEIEMLKISLELEKKGELKTNGATYEQNTGNVRNLSLAPKNPLEVTRVSHHPITGQLLIQREEIKSQVFRPFWNQPTMSLTEFGDRELQCAIDRSEAQKIAEEDAKLKPKRYEQLVRDGLEDNTELVDQSAEIDRKWDDFKDSNPRGCGNKMGDRGDRNF